MPCTLHTLRRPLVARATALAAVAISLAVSGGCKGDACEGQPTEIEVKVQLDENLAAASPSFIRVTLTLNDEVVVSREFDTPTPTFVFEPREVDEDPRSITVSAIAYADAEHTLGSGRIEATFRPDGCNFITLLLEGATNHLDASDATEIDDAGIDGDALSDGPQPDSCGYPCGQQCCDTDEICLGQTSCGHPESGATVVFATKARYRADMGGRAGSSSTCAAHKPDELSCSVLHALLTVSATDELRGMPSQYGYNADDALYFFHQSDRYLTRFADNWADALDAATPNAVSATTGTGVTNWSNTDGFWTGSKHDGSYDQGEYDYTCKAWICKDGSGRTCQQTLGTQGDPTVLDSWLHSSWNYMSCSQSLYLLCACKLE